MSTVSDDILLRVRRNETDLLGQAIEGWKEAHDWLWLVAQLEDHIVLVRPFPERMREACELCWKRIQDGRLTEYRAWGEEILSIYEAGLKLLAGMRTALQLVRANGYEVQGGDEVDTLRQTLQRDRDELADRWPWFDDESAAEGQAAFRRGELVDLDEAFAEAAGVSLETWRERVEARPRS